MPHKRKEKKEHETKLLFDPVQSFLYLAYTGETQDGIQAGFRIKTSRILDLTS